jgi:hypothetical protein
MSSAILIRNIFYFWNNAEWKEMKEDYNAVYLKRVEEICKS